MRSKARVIPMPKASMLDRDRTVSAHLPLVKAIAARLQENLPPQVEFDDLFQAGILGLIDAAEKFDPGKGVLFSSYAKFRIRGAIIDSLRELDTASRDMRRGSKKVEQARRELAAELQRDPTEAEIAERLGISEKRWKELMLNLHRVGLISASSRAEGDDLPAPDFPCSKASHPDSICLRQELRRVLKLAMSKLPSDRYRKVVRLYYNAGMSMKEIGGVIGVNESRVSQMHGLALEKMRVVLQDKGIASAQAF